MKIKFNWDIGIMLSLIVFITFIIYIAFIFPHVGSQLVSDRYYENEMKYQEIINQKKNVLKLPEKIKVFILHSGVEVMFPPVNNDIHGFFTLFRSSSKDLDFTQSFKILRSSQKRLLIPKKFLKKGYYKLIIRWKTNQKYFFEKDIFWNE
ncbi:Cytochrome Cbb3 Oxidase Maturation Protein CcoH [Blattabacterium sp. (Nauphoeta cinerea)]|uniref:FixH family protein n=1 Tax=Blattabacterium sp. (Nauphoeta cinerea) TaxID=1316444 RepID=UPI0003B03269|nr:FixH family protein [Blattabacterium sp. (Nauphoeta cinerea)]AGW86164.1 Cytochrome Cbb3 Oxidase Maturation Protein CcoH [Blattabacterium sp. (Nauphoeta cinerea)]